MADYFRARNRGTRIGCLAVAFAAVLCGPALGDVIDIMPGGALTVYRAPAVYRTEGVSDIVPARPGTGAVLVHAAAIPPGSVSSMIAVAAGRYAIDAGLLQRVAWQESRFHHDAVSPKGAVGVMQLMAATARDLGVDRYDPSQNILGGAAYLRQMLDRYAGNQSLALAAYNAGPGAVDRYRGIPPYAETQNYIRNIGGIPASASQLRSQSVIFIDP